MKLFQKTTISGRWKLKSIYWKTQNRFNAPCPLKGVLHAPDDKEVPFRGFRGLLSTERNHYFRLFANSSEI
jgi:hypothetical protein